MGRKRKIPEGCNGSHDVTSLRDFTIGYEQIGYRAAATNIASLRDLFTEIQQFHLADY